MFRASIGSKDVPRKPRIIMFFTLVATLSVNMSSIIMSRFVHQTQQLGEVVEKNSVASPHVAIAMSYTIPEWTVYSRGDNAGALLALANSPFNYPQRENDTEFSIHRTPYDITCRGMDVMMGQFTLMEHDPNSCMVLQFMSDSMAITKGGNVSIQDKGNKRGAAVIEVKTGPIYTAMSFASEVEYKNTFCSSYDMVGDLVTFIVNGTTSVPTTMVSRCWTKTGEMIVMSTTTVRFSAKANAVDRTAQLVLGETSMFREIEQGLMKYTQTNTTHTVSVLEYRVDGPVVQVSACIRGLEGRTEVPMGICALSTVNVIVARSSQLDAESAAKLGNTFGGNSTSVIATIKHLPTNNTLDPFGVRNSSFAVADMMATIGSSLNVDWNSAAIYFTFDVRKIHKGYEIANGLIVVAGVVLVACLIVSGWTLTFKSIHTESFYNIVTNRFVFRREKTKPMLTTCSLEEGLELGEGRFAYQSYQEQNELSDITKDNPAMEQSTSSLI
ncbi:hypothetical protein BGW38_009589 [Lunasporangiospora selenospora]|uniref:Uncharacterized protein n=1 Tax=Lunasporangiospora selenospora TaxID=979761 RepID=A0A9P6KFV5_9FUNG|nr:hypothetical protein BGW38_009589 [Lunasporangiospora selenospora]